MSRRTHSTRVSGTTAVDASGNGRTGVVVGATWATGRYGGALSFDGGDDYVGLPGLGTFYNTAFTLEAWVQKATTKNDVGIVGTWTGNGPMLWVDHLATRYHLTLGNDSSSFLNSGVSPSVGVWQHLAATFDGANARYYIDGVEVASRAFSGSVGTANTWRIGAYGSVAGGFFDGLIDEIRVYDRALSATEIQSDRDTPLGVAPGAPTEPGNLTVTGSTQTSVSLSWTASTDDVAVSGYTVYAGGAVAGTTTGTTFTVPGLSCSTGHLLEVEAFDGPGNVSPRASVTGSTTACDSFPGLVAAYAFDDGSGTTLLDASGYGRNGTVTGATWTTGRNGGALAFDGLDDHVALGSLGTLLQHRLHARGLGEEEHRQEGRRDRRLLEWQRADALGRPPRRPLLLDARREPLLLPRLGRQRGRRPVAARRRDVRRHDRTLLRRRQ